MQINDGMMDPRCFDDHSMGNCNNMGQCIRYCCPMCPMINSCPMAIVQKHDRIYEPEEFSALNITIKTVKIEDIKD